MDSKERQISSTEMDDAFIGTVTPLLRVFMPVATVCHAMGKAGEVAYKVLIGKKPSDKLTHDDISPV